SQGFGTFFKGDAKALPMFLKILPGFESITRETRFPGVPLPLTPIDGNHAQALLLSLLSKRIQKGVGGTVVNLAWSASCRRGHRGKEHHKVQRLIGEHLCECPGSLHFGGEHRSSLLPALELSEPHPWHAREVKDAVQLAKA